jgi:hypothetical protein
MLRRLHGDTTDDADIGTSTMNVGDVAMASRDLGEAAVLYREALAMLVRLHGGDDDYNIAVAVRKLAEVVGAQGHVAESVRQLRVSLEMFKRLYRDSASTSASASVSRSGADHPQVALCMRALAHALGKQGSMAESTRLHRESLAMLLRLHGRADDADVASGLSGLAATLQLQGDLPASVRLHTDALAMMVRLLCGSESREMAIVMGRRRQRAAAAQRRVRVGARAAVVARDVPPRRRRGRGGPEHHRGADAPRATD